MSLSAPSPEKGVATTGDLVPCMWRWQGPRGGWIADDAKPKWHSEPLYNAAVIAGLRAEIAELKGQKWFVQHTDTMNDLVQLGMARDAAEALITDLVTELSNTLGWVQHWLDDVAADVLPTRSSLADVEASIRAAIARATEGK